MQTWQKYKLELTGSSEKMLPRIPLRFRLLRLRLRADLVFFIAFALVYQLWFGSFLVQHSTFRNFISSLGLIFLPVLIFLVNTSIRTVSFQFSLIIKLVGFMFILKVEQSQESLIVSSIFHSPAVFKLNYAEMERRFKIFVYPDGDPNTYYHTPMSLSGKYASEGYFFKNIRESRFLSNDPEEAHLFFIPISCHKMRRKVILMFRFIAFF